MTMGEAEGQLISCNSCHKFTLEISVSIKDLQGLFICSTAAPGFNL